MRHGIELGSGNSGNVLTIYRHYYATVGIFVTWLFVHISSLQIQRYSTWSLAMLTHLIAIFYSSVCVGLVVCTLFFFLSSFLFHKEYFVLIGITLWHRSAHRYKTVDVKYQVRAWQEDKVEKGKFCKDGWGRVISCIS